MIRRSIELLRQHRSFLTRYLVVGGVNTLLGLSLFAILQTILGKHGIHYMFTLVLSQAICVTVSFFLLRIFVFQVKSTSFARFILYSAFHSTSFLLNLIGLPLIVGLTGRDPRVVQFSISLVVVLASFVWQSRVVFRR